MFTYVLGPSAEDFFKWSCHLFNLRHSVNKQIFCPETSSMFLSCLLSTSAVYTDVSVLVIYPHLFDCITFISDSLIQCFVFFTIFIYSIFFCVPSFFHELQNILSHPFLFSNAAYLTAALNITQCWSISSASSQTSNLF